MRTRTQDIADALLPLLEAGVPFREAYRDRLGITRDQARHARERLYHQGRLAKGAVFERYETSVDSPEYRPNVTAQPEVSRTETGGTTGQPKTYALPNPLALPKSAPTSEDEHKGDEWTAKRVVTERVTALEDLLRVCKADANEWSVLNWNCKAWEGFIKNADDEPELTPTMFSVSARFVRKTEAINLKGELAAMIADAAAHAPIYPKVRRSEKAGQPHLFECSIPDLHVGKLAHNDETGAGHYDGVIAERLFREALLDLIAKSGGYSVDRVCFVVGNDLLTSDGADNQTTAGTPQDTDSRYHKTFTRTRRLMVWAIEQLRLIAPVDVVIIPGNHDTLSCFTMGEVLAAWFRNADDVQVDNRAMMRKYYRYHDLMLLFTHGHAEKPHSRLAQIAAAEEPKLWGDVHFREAHLGHLHRLSVEDQMGFRVRVLPSLCAPDAWHSQSGFVGPVRSAEGFLWSQDRGLAGTVVHNVLPHK